MLPKIKVDRNYPTTIIIVPVSIGGLGLLSIEIQLTVELIDLFISLLESATPSKFLLRDSIELQQLESESITLVLEKDYQKVNGLVIKGL